MSVNVPIIAIVDDEESVRNALARLIRAAGFDVITFSSGADFLASLRERQPDCVLLDLRMPQTSGFEVQQTLSDAGMKLPVVLISSDDAPTSRTRALEQGACAYLLKPFDGEMVLDAIQAALRRDA